MVFTYLKDNYDKCYIELISRNYDSCNILLGIYKVTGVKDANTVVPIFGNKV